MNSLTRIMSYDKTKCENQENCNCENCVSKTFNNNLNVLTNFFKYFNYFPLSENDINKIIHLRYWYKDSKTKSFIMKALRVHGDKYDYFKTVYIKATEKVEIDCRNEKHPTFLQTPHDHLSKRGCAICGGKKKLTLEEFIEKANNVHGIEIYDYSKVIYVNARTEIEIVCPKHNSFWQTPNDHLSGCGCPSCWKEHLGELKKLTLEEFVEKARKIHGNLYDYSKVKYIDSHGEIEIICSKHDSFWQSASSHLCGCGCPKCRSSKGEIAVRKFLIDYGIKFEEQKRFDECKYKYKLPFDFYIPQNNICIEFDGEQHFKKANFNSHLTDEEKLKRLQSIQLRDQIKNDYCEKNGINLLRIRYDENVEEKLIEYFKQFNIL